ncbi:MAG: DUF2505 domain-containing protein [Ancrocorticia sp.]
MRIKQSITLDATTEQIVAALLSEELAAKRMKVLGVDDFHHKLEGNVAVTEANVPADQLPSKARSFAKNGVKATITARASGTNVTYMLDAHGLPVSLTWAVALSGANPTLANIEGDLKVKIPMIGSRIEKAAGERVDRLIAKEAKLISDVIAEQQ